MNISTIHIMTKSSAIVLIMESNISSIFEELVTNLIPIIIATIIAIIIDIKIILLSIKFIIICFINKKRNAFYLLIL